MTILPDRPFEKQEEGMTKQEYEELREDLAAMITDCGHPIAVLANSAALLWERVPDLNWAGFYLVEKDMLVLGPFQGRPACVEIGFDKGVCGRAWASDCVQVVPDVHAFVGHIPCDSASASELVLPLHRGKEVVGVLDLDSPTPGRFTEADACGLAGVAALIENVLWPAR